MPSPSHASVVAADAQPAGKIDGDALGDAVYTFITDRLRRYFLDRDSKLAPETFDAVVARGPASLVDFELRLKAVQSFIELESASSLSAANKRIANILKQAADENAEPVRKNLLQDASELALWKALGDAKQSIEPMLAERPYEDALAALAELREPVDRFFDDVMVMVDDSAIRSNRLALLSELRSLFLDIADISRLSI